MLCINAPFPQFPMPSGNLIGFGTCRHLTFRRKLFLVSYSFIYYEKNNDKRKDLEIHRSTLNAHCIRRKATLYFTPAIAATVESLVTDVTDVLIRFPIIAQCSKGTHYFHRVVGLVVINIHK